MKIVLQAHAHFEIQLSRDHVNLLIKYSEHHYDAKCRSAAVPSRDQHHPFAGLLIGWRNSLDFWADSSSPEKSHVTATESQLDLLQKCMEYRHPGSSTEEELLRHELQRLFRDCRLRWRDLYEKWHAEWEFPNIKDKV